MLWQQGRRSSNVEDRRGMGRPLAVGGGAVSIVVALLMYLLGGSPFGGDSVDVDPQQQSGTGGAGQVGAPSDQLGDFVSVVLASTEDTWPAILRPEGVRYEQPKLILFSDAVQSACGLAESAVGPFYCPRDANVYLDLSFFRDLERMGAPGDFAQAYVIAHEVGHHVQNLLGVSERTHSQMQRMGEAQRNALSVRVELQADCYAGVWAHHANRARPLLEAGDVEEGLRAAAAIGDDRLQRQSRGYVVPESFTHGSSAQRLSWFKRGFDQGTLEACDTLR